MSDVLKLLLYRRCQLASATRSSERKCMAGPSLSLKRLSAGPGFNPQTRQKIKVFQDYWRACFEINFSDRQEGLTVSSIM